LQREYATTFIQIHLIFLPRFIPKTSR